MEKVFFEIDGVRHHLVPDSDSFYCKSDYCSLYDLCSEICLECLADYFSTGFHFEEVYIEKK